MVEPLLTKLDLTERYPDTTVNTVNKWVATGTGPPSIKVGKRRYWRMADVIAWEDANTSTRANA